MSDERRVAGFLDVARRVAPEVTWRVYGSSREWPGHLNVGAEVGEGPVSRMFLTLSPDDLKSPSRIEGRILDALHMWLLIARPHHGVT